MHSTQDAKVTFEHNNSSSESIESLSTRELYANLQQIQEENLFLQLENYLLEDYLRKRGQIAFFATHAKKDARLRTAESSDSFNEVENTSSHITKSTTTETIEGHELALSSSSPHVRKHVKPFFNVDALKIMEPKLSNRIKIDLTEKLCSELAHQCNCIERTFKIDTKKLTAIIAEYRLTNSEAIEMKAEFQQYINKHASAALNNRLPSEKFIRLLEDWIKNGSGLVGQIRLRNTSQKQSLPHKLTILERKAELHDKLMPMDFELLQIDKKKKTKKFEAKNQELLSMKKFYHKIQRDVTDTSNSLIITEKYYKELDRKINSLSELLKRIIAAIDLAEQTMNTSRNEMLALSERTEKYAAPGILDYASKKHVLQTLEKEKKILERQNYLFKIKLANMNFKWKTKAKLEKLYMRYKSS